MQPQLDVAAARAQAASAPCAVAWLVITAPGAGVDTLSSTATCAGRPAAPGNALQLVLPVVVHLGAMHMLPRSQVLQASHGDLLTAQAALMLPPPVAGATGTSDRSVQVLAWNASQPWLQLLQPTEQRLPGPIASLGLLLRVPVTVAAGFAAGPGLYGASLQLSVGTGCSAPGVCSASHFATTAVFVRVFAGGASPLTSTITAQRTAGAGGSVLTGAVALRDAAGTPLELNNEQSVHVQAIFSGLASTAAGVPTPAQPLQVFFVASQLAQVAARAAAAAAAPSGLSDAQFMAALQAAADGVPTSASALVAARSGAGASGSVTWRAALNGGAASTGATDINSGPVAVSSASCAAEHNLVPAPVNVGGCSCSAGTQPSFARLLATGWTSASDPWISDTAVSGPMPSASANTSVFHVLSPAVPCISCPAGTFRAAGVLSPAPLNASVPLTALMCSACPDGTYSLGGTATCIPCPDQGASCSNGQLQLFPGYWSPPLKSRDTPPAIIKCVNLGDCQPAPAIDTPPPGNAQGLLLAPPLRRALQSASGNGGDEAALTTTPLAQCAPGHTGILCRTCSAGRTLAFGQCLECPAPALAQTYIAGAFLFLVVVPLAAVVLACHHRPCGCGPSAGQEADNAEWRRAAHAKERKLRARKRAARAKRSEGRKDRRHRDAEAEVTDDESSGEEEGVKPVKGGKKSKRKAEKKKGVDTSIVRIIKPASEMRGVAVPPGHGKRAGLRAPRRDAWDEKQRTKGQRGCRGRTRTVLRAAFCCSYADGNDEAPGQPGCWACRPCCGRLHCRVVGDGSISGRHFLAVGPRNHTTYYVHESGQVDDVLTQLRLLWHWLSGALLLLLFVDVAAPASVARSASLASGLLDAIAVSVSPQTWPWGCAMSDELRMDLALPIFADGRTGAIGDAAAAGAGNGTAGAVVAWADSYDSLQTAYGAPIFFAISVAGCALLSCVVGSARVQRYVTDLRAIAVWMSPNGPRAVIDASRVPARRCGCGPGQSLVPCCTTPLDAPPPTPLDVNAPGLTPMERARRKRANAAAYNPHTGARLIRSDEIPTGQRSGTVIGHAPSAATPRASPRRGTVVARAAAKASAAASATRDAVGLWCTGLFRVPSASNGMLVALLALMLVNAPVLRGATMALTRLPQPVDAQPHLRYAPELSTDSPQHTTVVLTSSALAVLLLLLVPLVVYVLAYRAHTVLSRSRYRLYGPQQRFQASWEELHAPPPVVPLKSKRQVGPDGKMVTVTTPQWGFIQPGSIWRRAPLAPVPAAAWYHIAYVLSPLLAGLHENTVISWMAYDKAAAAAGLDGAGLLDDRARPWTHRRSGRLRRTLRAPRFWWFLLEMGRPLLLAGFGVIGQSQDKLLSLCVLCLFFLALQVAYFPYATRRQNLLAAGHLATWLLLCMALQYTHARDLRDAVVALSQGGGGGDDSAQAQGVSENDALSRDTTISILSFLVIAAWGVITLGSLLVAVFRLVFWPAVRAQYQWSITPGNRRYSCSHVLFRMLCFGLRDPLRLRYPPSLEQTREAAIRAQKGKDERAAPQVQQEQPTSTSKHVTPRDSRTGSQVNVANPIHGGLGSLAEGDEGHEGGASESKGAPSTQAASHLSPNLASTLRPADPSPLGGGGGTPPRAQIRPPSGKAPPALGSTRKGTSPARQHRTPKPVEVGSRQVSTATVRRVSTFGAGAGAGSGTGDAAHSRGARMRRMSNAHRASVPLASTAEDAVHSSDESEAEDEEWQAEHEGEWEAGEAEHGEAFDEEGTEAEHHEHEAEHGYEEEHHEEYEEYAEYEEHEEHEG